MLIQFQLENWMSFREEATFSMVASKKHQHRERISRLRHPKLRILPTAAIFGGNAAGKTSLCSALSFAKWFVVRGTMPKDRILVNPFRLDPTMMRTPVRFVFTIATPSGAYEFGFKVTDRDVVDEYLDDISGSSVKHLYHREQDNPDPSWDSTLLGDKGFLDFVFKGTRSNQLFLNNAATQGVKAFEAAYDWFRDSLLIVRPGSHFALPEQFLGEDDAMYKLMGDVLSQLDTGIVRLGGDEIPLESVPAIEKIKRVFAATGGLGDMSACFTAEGTSAPRFAVIRKGDALTAHRLYAYHLSVSGEEVKFDMSQEADGTQRVIDLFPLFFDLTHTGYKVCIIDEIDRSLHTLLTQGLLSGFLDSCSEQSTSQLIFTTHDAMLMDSNIFRRDEMWVTERDKSGASSLYSLDEFQALNSDKNIRRSYLQGLLGGIPRLRLNAFSRTLREGMEDGYAK